MCRAGASILNGVNGLSRSGGLLFWNTGWIPVDAFEFGICAVGASWPLAITAGPTRMSDTELTEPGTDVDGVAAYFRRLQVSHAREILLRTLRLSPRGLSGSKLDAMRAADHVKACGPAFDHRAEAGQRMPRGRRGSMQQWGGCEMRQ